MKQLSFQGFKKPQDAFGGELLTSHPKGKRPLDSKFPILLTLRATKSVLKNPKLYGKIEKTIDEVAKKYHVKIYKRANVGNHLHQLIKLPNIKVWASFIRELTGRIGLICKNMVQGKLWKFRPHTRIVRGWQKAFRIALDYVKLNQLESQGEINRKQIKNLAEYRKLLFRQKMAVFDRDGNFEFEAMR